MTGPLLGTGVLAIWNGIANGQDDAFLRWHVEEHIPERVAVPGFLRARRYVALHGQPRYFNFYEVVEPEVLVAPAYLARLDDPTPRTRAILPHFTDMIRTPCRVVASRGQGVAGTVATLRLDGPVAPLRNVAAALAGEPGVSAVHLLEQAELAMPGTAEAAIRGGPDRAAKIVLLAEGPDADTLDAAVSRHAPKGERGLYRLDFLLCADPAAPSRT
ncbi:MAG: hypothetical protein CVT80_07870 [Alphaproteobacteria bacterium HGW-Alphaproteobacteria-2]|nr:MAG: hypothetical protein CVT80_07870 [Alphaproteobacteria bacterium HGW-Alphaproteobacteria-2]